QGTTSADRALSMGGRLLISSLLSIIDLEGFNDLTTQACGALNRRLQDAEATNGVRYRAVTSVQDLLQTTPFLQPTWIQLNHEEGPSDGIVSRRSQAWTETLVSATGKT